MATSAPLKEVLLVGFGAVGAMYSFIIKRSGLARVTAVARSNYDLVTRNGIHIKSQKYGDIPGWSPDRLRQSVSHAADQAYDYVVITTKAVPDLVQTSQILAPLLSPPYTETHPQPSYVVLQNGLNVEVDLYRTIKRLGNGEPKVIGTSLYIGTNLLAPDVVEHNDFDRVSLGIYRHNDYTTTVNSPEEIDTLNGIAEVLKKGGSTVKVVPEIQRVKFAKNFWNVAFSSFSTLTDYTLPAIFRPPPSPSVTYAPYVSPKTAALVEQYTIPGIEAVLLELVALGRALGFPDNEDGLPSLHVQRTIDNTRKLHMSPQSVHKPSMLLDAQRGQPIEVEVIFGEVVRMARERNVPVPRIETLYALLLVVQNQIIRKTENSRL
ncbi:6-phosphogluconate dehydrogenase C-terminal domain-like protein [Marasmius fiardii PR-910]|nr:6-phosphogluconate dehydrogenase C-terminal domain-like protein [Marasmius fiardii PR-910]